MNSLRIVLASTSPSRLYILRTADIEPLTVALNVNRDSLIAALPDAASVRIAEQLVQAKAHAIAPRCPNNIVIGRDSMLFLGGHLQRKPRTEGKAIEWWHQQNDRIIELVTGYCVVAPEGKHIEVVITSLDFAKVPEEGTRVYAATGEPLECAGALTLEALGDWFVDGISGNPSNVVGLSLPVVRKALCRYGYSVSQFRNRQSTHEQSQSKKRVRFSRQRLFRMHKTGSSSKRGSGDKKCI